MINPGGKEIPPEGRRRGWEKENRYRTGWVGRWEAILAGPMAAAGGISRKFFE